ncbi:MAG TPA: hypothetical protein ENJ37_05005 [Deltaproteobacteria bacterium]|nr:hypothetical protein [Deltaproteobacteria bacterium]
MKRRSCILAAAVLGVLAAAALAFSLWWCEPSRRLVRAVDLHATAPDVRFGVYFYPWYDKGRWAVPRRHTPLRGEYDSTDPGLIAAQMDEIRSAGFDYVIIEMVPPDDHAFGVVEKGIEAAVARLREIGMEWTFLIDAAFLLAPERTAKIHDMMAYIEKRGWTDGLTDGPTGRDLLLVFAPDAHEADLLLDRYGGRYELRFPNFHPRWSMAVDEEIIIPGPRTGRLREKARTGRVSIYEYLKALGFIAFWTETGQMRLFDGFVSVVPGYDDTLLERTPQVAPIVGRREGRTYAEQLERAMALGPEHVLVYSWNEYLEATAIEPTREFGRLYVDMTRRFIERVRSARAQAH